MVMRIAISGSTGLVGEATTAELTARGHEVVRLVRSTSDDDGSPDPMAQAHWDTETGAVDPRSLGPIDAVVHLAGENVAGGRWTDSRRRRIEASRGPATERLCRTLAALPSPPGVIVSASATGIYGPRGDEPLDESSALGPDDDFLARVAKDWEAGTSPLADVGTRVVNLRLGVVLSGEGGALQRMLLPFRLGLGGRLGSGRQWFSWITRNDVVRAIVFALENDSLQGPVLAVAPDPVTNREFTKTLGKVLRRPTVLPVPAFALRLLLGEMANMLLTGQRAHPRALQEAGFEFEHAQLEPALRSVLDE